MDEFSQVLFNALSADPNVRQAATKYLETLAQTNFGVLMQQLAERLAREGLETQIRHTAGLVAKNSLRSTQDTNEQTIKSNKWLQLDENLKNSVRSLALQGLAASDQKVGMAAAQLVSAIAFVELPVGKWTEVIRHLLNFVQTPNNPFLVCSSLQALGYICEETGETASEVLTKHSGEILQAVVLGAAETQPDEVQIAAITSLNNSLEFVKHNFEREADRNYIMQVVCTATQRNNIDVKVAAFQCLVKIMSLYYSYMEPYMTSALYALTVYAMQNGQEPVVLQAIEFWSTVCDVETQIDFMEAEAPENSHTQESLKNRGFARTALPHIVPQLLRLLTKQDEDSDDDDWNVSKASSTCIYLLAKCVGNDIVPLILPFVENSITSQEWRRREAALMAFGSIMEGPDPEVLQPLATQAFPLLIQSLSDPKTIVQDAAAWTIGSICDLLPRAITDEILPVLVDSLARGLKLVPKVANSCAWSINNLAESYYPEDSLKTYPLSPFFPGLVSSLFEAISRPDATEANFKISAYAALNSLVESAAEDTYTVLMQLTDFMLDRLEKGIANENQILNADERREHAEEQANICAILTSGIRKLEGQISPLADRIMQVMIKIFNSPMSSRNAEILEDAILTVGALATALGILFKRYVEAFNPYLLQSLSNVTEHTVCLHSVGLVGDICRALAQEVAPYCDVYMSALLHSAQNDQVHRDVKPHVLSCFGDVAFAIGPAFHKYLNNCMIILASAAEVELDQNEYGNQEYMTSLRTAITEGYVGIVGAFSGHDSSPLLPYADNILRFTHKVYSDPQRSDELQRAAVGLIGDLAECCGKNLSVQFHNHQNWISSFCRECVSSKNQMTQQTGTWAMERVRAAL